MTTNRMTMIRRLALKVLNTAARHAAPGTRDWVTAMSREMDFIENDWAALWWALGSTRILFRREHVPLADLSAVPRAAQCLINVIRVRTRNGCVAMLIVFAAYFWFIFTLQGSMQRVGSGLVAASMLYMAYQVYARRAGTSPLETDSAAWAGFYRTELERQRDFHRGFWFWSRLAVTLPGFILFCVGGAIARPADARGYTGQLAVFILLGIWSVPLNLGRARKYQCQLDDLEALQKQLK
jgi:hypothetical protein